MRRSQPNRHAPGARRRAVGFAVLLALASVGPAFGQSGNVLGVVPEGAVVDAATIPDVRPGARIGFRRPDGGTAQVGEGFVLEVREGRALIGLKPGGSVQAGDLALPCASLSGPGSQGDLRASVQTLRTQLAAAGGGSAELQAAVGQLESTLDAREAAIRDGACDVASYDQQIADLSLQLQQMLAASAASVPPAATLLPPPGAVPGTEPGQQTMAGATPQSPPISQGGIGREDVLLALQVTQQLLVMAQTAGLIRSGERSGGQQPVDVPLQTPPPALLPTDPAVGQPSPPVVEGPRLVPSPAVSQGEPVPPPPSPAAVPPETPSKPAPGRATIPEKPSPQGVVPPITRPPGSPRWWTITPPKQPAPVAGITPGDPSRPPASGTVSKTTTTPGKVTPPATSTTVTAPARVPAGSQTVPGVVTQPRTSTGPGASTPPVTTKPPPASTPPPIVKSPSDTPAAPPGPIASVPPARQGMAIVHGVVRADNGAPIPGALVSVANKQVKTNAQGVFVVTDVPLGRQTLLVKAGGFTEGKLAIELTSGEVEKVALTLRRASPAPAQTPR